VTYLSGTTVPLAVVEEGKTAVIIGFRGGAGAVQKLISLGFLPGTPVRVVRNQRTGPLVVEIKGTRVALGRGLAMKVEVRRT